MALMNHLRSPKHRSLGLGEVPADVTFQQLGGRRLIVMTGAKVMRDGDNRLVIKLPASLKPKSNLVAITYVPGRDTYEVRFSKLGRAPTFKEQVVYEAEDVYADQLRPMFEQYTGLRASL